MNDFLNEFLNGFAFRETKEQIVKKYVNGTYNKDEFIQKMKEWERRNGQDIT